MTRRVHPTPRLEKAIELLHGASTVADVGSDHGRLAAVLLQRGLCNKVIATDISAESLQKARELLSYIGLSEQTELRVGDGLRVLKPFECEGIALLGMGGTLMSRILEEADELLQGARFAVLQPMTAQADIRRYLHERNFWITEDALVQEGRRFYQVFRAEPRDSKQPIPNGFPEDFYEVGFIAFLNRDPLFSAYCRKQKTLHERQWREAKGTDGEEKLYRWVSAWEMLLSQEETK